MRARAILIAGPTASGKSALALEFARRRRGAIVNADSMQVYRDLRIVTARPTIEEEAAAPHPLLATSMRRRTIPSDAGSRISHAFYATSMRAN